MEGNPGAIEAVPAATGSMLDGRYRLLERIGRGGMADVYAAEDDLLHRRVAIKLFRFDLCTAAELRRVHAEMQTLAALQHPGLVTIYDAGSVRETAGDLLSPYLVMELVGGPNLGRRLSAEGPLTPDDAARLGADLAATLAYVHARNVVHRDVKPANILLDANIADDAPFVTKLTDFGIARVVDSTHYTEAGFTVGTANYLSPEQARCREVGTATDVYSLGLVLIESLTGRLAFPGSGVEAALARLHRQPPVPAGFGGAWQRLLTAATAAEPGDRPTADELATELAGLAGQAGVAPVPLGSPAPPPVAARPTEHTQAWTPEFLRQDGPPTVLVAVAPAGRHRRGRRPALLAAAVAVAVAVLSTGFLVRSAHSGGTPRSGPRPSRAAEQSSLPKPSSSSPVAHATAVVNRSSTTTSAAAGTARSGTAAQPAAGIVAQPAAGSVARPPAKSHKPGPGAPGPGKAKGAPGPAKPKPGPGPHGPGPS
ncbi:MAG TPA: serine/threonine-protein kinase [Jatrophihabitans sp.]|nr:serine/threonine-protein kinase [Jatrophihabitans sp.]